jgi:hypothetical protein
VTLVHSAPTTSRRYPPSTAWQHGATWRTLPRALHRRRTFQRKAEAELRQNAAQCTPSAPPFTKMRPGAASIRRVSALFREPATRERLGHARRPSSRFAARRAAPRHTPRLTGHARKAERNCFSTESHRSGSSSHRCRGSRRRAPRRSPPPLSSRIISWKPMPCCDVALYGSMPQCWQAARKPECLPEQLLCNWRRGFGRHTSQFATVASWLVGHCVHRTPAPASPSPIAFQHRWRRVQ